MSRNALKASAKRKTSERILKSKSISRSDLVVDDMLAQVVAFAREIRAEEAAPETTHAYPNFKRILQVSGRLIFINDVMALLAAFTCGGFIAWAADIYLFHAGFQPLLDVLSAQQFAIFASLGAMALLWLDTKGHYRQRLPYWEATGHVVLVTFFGFLGAGFLHFAAKSSASSRLWMGLSWALFAIFLFVGRTIARRVLDTHGQWKIPAVVIGTGATAKAAIQAMQREPEMGFDIVAHMPPVSVASLEKPNAWKNVLMTHKASHIFLALEGSEIERNPDAMKAMVRARIPCSIVPPWLGLPSSTLSPHHFMMHDIMMLHDTNRLQLPMPRFVKRGFDVLVSALALVALSPVFLIVMILVKRDGGPAFFIQDRVGMNGKLFGCHKFRSMCVDAEESLKQHLAENPDSAKEWEEFQKLKNDVRITKFGEFIRRTSIDELPQLVNVLLGDMSLVGPRPCMPGQEDFYAEDFSFYESVRPGITGPWQVSGRSRLTFKERVHLESWYARNWSLWMDIVILLKTVPTLLKKDGAF